MRSRTNFVVAVSAVVLLIFLFPLLSRIVTPQLGLDKRFRFLSRTDELVNETAPSKPHPRLGEEAQSINRADGLVNETAPSKSQPTLGAEAQSLSRADGLVNETAPEAACCRISNGFTLEQLCNDDGSIQISETAKVAKDQGCTCFDFFYCRLVVVTALSDNHYGEAHDMIASVQKFLPHTKLIVYDLGLNPQHKQELHHYCNVVVRPFQFEKYPPHTRTLTTYAWKPLMVNEVARTYEVILWGDSSVRVKGSSFAEKMFPRLLKFPFVSGSAPALPIVSLTHDGMLKYLNLSLSRKQMGHYGTQEGGCWVMWVNTLMKTKFLNYWVDCALHKECIAPRGASLWNCNLGAAMKKTGVYVGCHRYDQSALNMILIREFGLDVWTSTVHDDSRSLLQVNRKATHDFPLKKC